MSLDNINRMKQERGFTIVELLIVIVIIGILAAITIVAYNGIQNRAKASSAQSIANTIVKKAEAWNSIQSSYPSVGQLSSGKIASETPAAGPQEARLDNAASVSATAPTSGNGTSTVQMVACAGNTGVRVNYFDYVNDRVTSATTDPKSLTAGSC